MFMRTLKILLYFLILTTFILLGFLFSQITGKVVYKIEKANITRIIDGDTIETNIGKVRLLGINTPEKKEKGWEEAKNFLLQFQGKEIELIRTKEDKDKYNRFLRYVFYSGRMLNEEILAKGLANFYSYNEEEYTKILKKAEEKARKQELEIWEKSQDVCASCIILIELNKIDPGEYVLLENACSFNCNLDAWTIKDDATHIRKLDFEIPAKENKKIDYEGRVWNDAGDSLYLRDSSGFLVLFYRY